MASMTRPTITLVGRHLARPSVVPVPQLQLASSFASSSRVRLDSPSVPPSTPSSSTSTPTPAPTPSSSGSLASSIVPPSRPIPRNAKPKYRVPSPTQSMGVDNQLLTLTVSATRNNTLLTLSDKTGPIFPTISAGTDKSFKNSQRASYEAAHQAALKMFDRILDYDRVTGGGGGHTSTSSSSSTGQGYSNLSSNVSGMGNRRMKVVFQGLRGGQGREAVASALGGQEGEAIQRLIGRVEDRTGIKIGGTRGKRVRRL